MRNKWKSFCFSFIFLFASLLLPIFGVDNVSAIDLNINAINGYSLQKPKVDLNTTLGRYRQGGIIYFDTNNAFGISDFAPYDGDHATNVTAYPHGYQVFQIKTYGCTFVHSRNDSPNNRFVGVNLNGAEYSYTNTAHQIVPDNDYWTLIYRNESNSTSIWPGVNAEFDCEASTGMPSFTLLSYSVYDNVSDYHYILNQIHQDLEALKNKSDAPLLNQINQSVQQTTDAVKEQTQQQQDQYEEEKNEENRREEEMKEQSGGLGFSFSVSNPFDSLLSGFTSGNSCANIPIIAGMVNSTHTQFCPWFSSTVRGIVTPVVSIIGMVILFGFVVRWLTSSDFNGSIKT